MSPRHFLDLDQFDAATLRRLLDSAHAMKAARRRLPESVRPDIATGRVLVMIFEKPSTRTRVSFDVAMRQLGGQTIVLNHGDLQLGRGETIADTARVLSRYSDLIMIRSQSHQSLLEFAEHATIPVINGLTNLSHPCQIMADMLTVEERLGRIEDTKVAWVGDGNNVAASWIHAAALLGFELRLACPPEFSPRGELLDRAIAANRKIRLTTDAGTACDAADCVVADTWVSMGDVDGDRRRQILRPYQVDSALMARAANRAIFLHDLPAYRGNEVTAEVIDGPQSVVFDEAENRLHAQKAILAWCLGA